MAPPLGRRATLGKLARWRGVSEIFPLPLTTEPMEAKSADELPAGGGWNYEPKWDGFRCLAFRAGAEVALRAKSGKPLERYFPDVVERLRGLPAPRFVLDGELVIAVDGTLRFDALQLRLHPAASRVAKLARENPARLVVFDLLADASGASLIDRPLAERREALEAFVAAVGAPAWFPLSPVTRDLRRARRWLANAGAGATDGVVAKRRDDPYRAGERAMIKVKRLRTADCVVGGFRYLRERREVGSLLLGLYDADGKLDHVGFTATIADADRPELTRRLEALVEPPGFTGRAPGGPSRWSGERAAQWEPLRPKLVVEVRFDHVTAGRLRHGATLVRWRPDKAPEQCRMEQIGA